MVRSSSLLALFAAFTAGAAEPVEVKDFPSAHRCIQLVEWGAWSPTFSFTLADNHFVVERQDPVPQTDGSVIFVLAKQDCINLEKSRASEAWSRIDRLGVLQWKESYRPEDLHIQIFDGTSWSVVLRVNGVEKNASGFNVYPALAPLGAPTLESSRGGHEEANAYSELLQLFRTLK